MVEIGKRVASFLRVNGVGIGLAFFICAVVFMHVSPSFIALNYFDPPKRLLWSVLAVVLSGTAFFSCRSIPKGIRFSLVGVLLWVVFRSLLSENPTAELEVLATWILPGVLFGLGLTINRDRALKPIAWTLLLCGAIQGVLMCLQYFGKDPLFFETTSAFTRLPHRMIGTIGNQNQAADILALSCVALFFLIRRPVLRLLFSGSLLVIVSLTACRGAMIALAGAIFASEIFLVLSVGRERARVLFRLTLVGAVILAIIASALMLMPRTRERFSEIATRPLQSRTLNFRATMVRISSKMWSEKPLVGWGAGAFAFQYLDRLENEVSGDESYEELARLKYVREAHNDYLQFAAEFGWIGLAGISCLLFFIFRTLWKSRLTEQTASVCCLFILSYLSLKCLISFPLQAATAGPLAALLLGIMLPRSDQAFSQNSRHSIRGTASVFLVLSLALLVWNGIEVVCNLRLPLMLQQGEALRASLQVPRCVHKHHALIGASLAHDEEYVDALRELQHAYEGYRDPLLYNNLGHVFSKLGEWSEDVKIYEKWVACGLNYSPALENLSIAYEQAGDIRQAARIGEKRARFFDCDEEEPILRVASLYLKNGDAQAAFQLLEWYEAHPTVLPDSGSAEYDNLSGAVFLSIGDRSSAEKRFRSALRKNPALRSAHRNLNALGVSP